jgi:hypothetical protein
LYKRTGNGDDIGDSVTPVPAIVIDATWGARRQGQSLQTAGRVQEEAKVWVISVDVDNYVVWNARETRDPNVAEGKPRGYEDNQNSQR